MGTSAGKKQKIMCPHCGWTGGPGLVSYWHLDGRCQQVGSTLLIDDKIKTALSGKARLMRCKEWLRGLLGGCCTYCGESDESFLQFEHRNGGGHQEQKLSRNHTAIRYDRWYRHGKITEKEIHSRLTLACHRCNYLKGTMTEKQWRNWVHSGDLMEYVQRLLDTCPLGDLPRVRTTPPKFTFTVYPIVYDPIETVTDPPYPSGPTA